MSTRKFQMLCQVAKNKPVPLVIHVAGWEIISPDEEVALQWAIKMSNKFVATVIKLRSFFFGNPKSDLADLCKSMLVNVCRIFSMNEGYLLLQWTHPIGQRTFITTRIPCINPAEEQNCLAAMYRRPSPLHRLLYNCHGCPGVTAGNSFVVKGAGHCYLTFSFGMQNECSMS